MTRACASGILGVTEPGKGAIAMTDRTLRVGLLGCGNVGAAVIRLLDEHAEDIAMRAGCRLEVTRVAVRDLDRERDVPVPATAFTTDAASIVDDPAIAPIYEAKLVLVRPDTHVAWRGNACADGRAVWERALLA